MSLAADVKLFRYTDGGAPTLNGAAGSLSSLLYTCLVTGYNVKTPGSITRDGSTVTVTFASAHGYLLYSVIRVSGAEQEDYNGDFRVTSVATNSLTIELAAGVTPTTPATGTIETRFAPAGWTREFNGTNVSVFKSSDSDATGCRMRVDDSGTLWTTVRGYISMTDVDTGVEPFPPSQSLYWHKSSDTGTTRQWVLVADSKAFYFGNVPDGSYGRLHTFGDIITYKPGDVYHCLLSGNSSTSGADYLQDVLIEKNFTHEWVTPVRLVVARDYGGVENMPGYLATIGVKMTSVYNIHSSPIGGVGLSYPHPTDNGFVYGNVFFKEYNSSLSLLRGYPPGLYDPWHAVLAALGSVDTIINNVPASGRKAILWRVYYSRIIGSESLGATDGNAMLDIIGPWRE